MQQSDTTEHLELVLERLAQSEQNVRVRMGKLLDGPCLFDSAALRQAAALLTAAAELADVVGLLPAHALLVSGHASARHSSPRRRAAASERHRPDAEVVSLGRRSRSRHAFS
jgi:hypothetical protein